jgi:hypothetical protein
MHKKDHAYDGKKENKRQKNLEIQFRKATKSRVKMTRRVHKYNEYILTPGMAVWQIITTTSANKE